MLAKLRIIQSVVFVPSSCSFSSRLFRLYYFSFISYPFPSFPMSSHLHSVIYFRHIFVLPVLCVSSFILSHYVYSLLCSLVFIFLRIQGFLFFTPTAILLSSLHCLRLEHRSYHLSTFTFLSLLKFCKNITPFYCRKSPNIYKKEQRKKNREVQDIKKVWCKKITDPTSTALEGIRSPSRMLTSPVLFVNPVRVHTFTSQLLRVSSPSHPFPRTLYIIANTPTTAPNTNPLTLSLLTAAPVKNGSNSPVLLGGAPVPVPPVGYCTSVVPPVGYTAGGYPAPPEGTCG